MRNQRTREVVLELGTITIKGDIPISKTNGLDAITSEDLYVFHAKAAQVILERGVATGPALKILRAVTRLTGTAMAELLGVTKETVSRWETGARDAKVDTSTWLAYAQLARDALTGRSDTVKQLRQLQVSRLQSLSAPVEAITLSS